MRPIHLSFIIAITAISVSGYTQRPVTAIDKKIDSLKSAGIDSILLYSSVYLGFGLPKDDTCGYSDSYFLIWKSEDNVFYQKFQMDGFYTVHCFSEAAHYKNSAVYILLNKYAKTLRSERFMPFVAKFEANGLTWYQPLFTFHPSYYRLEFYYKNEDEAGPAGYEHYPAHAAVVETEALLDKNAGGVRNLNYEYNINTRTMQLINCIQSEIVNLEANNYLLLQRFR